MEDSHILCPEILPGISLFGVFDGHGGNWNLIKFILNRKRSC